MWFKWLKRGTALSFAYSLLDGLIAGIQMYTSFLIDDPNQESTHTVDRGPIIAAVSTAVITGGVFFVTAWYFQGSEIRKRLNHNYESDSDSDSELNEQQPLLIPSIEPSAIRKISYITVQILYVCSALGINYTLVKQLYSATKNRINDPFNEGSLPLSSVSIHEQLWLMGYFILLNAPFSLTNEIAQTYKALRKKFGFSADNAPDVQALRGLNFIVRPIAKYRLVSLYIRWIGSLSDAAEHIIPLADLPLDLLPSPWLKTIGNNPFLLTPALAISIPSLLLITVVIYNQTQLFEGRYSLKNVRAIAGETSIKEERWISLKTANVFHYLLYLGGFIQGVDACFSLYLGLSEFKLAKPIIYSLSGTGLVIFWAGNHYSEVKESQSALKKITTFNQPFSFFSKPPSAGDEPALTENNNFDDRRLSL